jgi:hypothetical protein
LLAWLVVGEGFFDGLRYFFDGGFLGEFSDIRGVGLAVEAKLGGDVAVHFEDGGDLFFGEDEDLKHEVISFVGAAAKAGLADKDEAGDEDGLHGDGGLEQGERTGVDVVGVREGVEEYPEGEEEEVGGDEGEAADVAGDGVGEAFGGGALGKEVLLVAGDELDVGLNVTRGLGRGFGGLGGELIWCLGHEERTPDLRLADRLLRDWMRGMDGALVR